ncbi:MAG TPA: hypothetical protein VMV90_03875 [Rectinemataceae bacterium]|nr:hypothetical protein [Rectinemataceae bacterium]
MRSVRRPARPPLRAAAVLVLFLAPLGTALSAQEVAAWFASSSAAAVYAGIRVETESLAASAAARGVPESLFVRRLAEGAEKRIPPERLASALRDDEARFTGVALLLRLRRLLPPEPERSGRLIWQGSLLLRAGATSPDLAAALDAAAATAGGAFARAERAFDALGLTVSLNARFGLPSAVSGRLAAAIVRSPLERRGFASLISVFARGKASGLSSDLVADIAIRVLDSGGSFEAIEREMQRRTRYP